MLRNSARSFGRFRPQWLADYYRLRQPALPALLKGWQDEGLVVPVMVEELGKCGCIAICKRRWNRHPAVS